MGTIELVLHTSQGCYMGHIGCVGCGYTGKWCHALQIFGDGILDRSAPACSGSQAQVGADSAHPDIKGSPWVCAPGSQRNPAVLSARAHTPCGQALRSDGFRLF